MITKFQPPCYVQGHQPPDRAAQSHTQPGLECLQGYLIVAFQYLKRTYEQEGKRLFTRVDSDRTRGNSFKLTWGGLG